MQEEPATTTTDTTTPVDITAIEPHTTAFSTYQNGEYGFEILHQVTLGDMLIASILSVLIIIILLASIFRR